MNDMQIAVTTDNLRPHMDESLKTELDENLMLRYRDGDVAAFEVLYSRHKGALFRYFIRQCSESTIAEELFQESWMSIIKSRINYVKSAKFKTYMYTIAHNKLVDYYRRTNIKFNDRINGEKENSETIISELPARRKDQPEQILSLEQKRVQLLKAIKLLPEVQREVFLLRQECGFSLSEIAIITKVAMGTTKSRLRYAVKSLRTVIKAGGL